MSSITTKKYKIVLFQSGLAEPKGALTKMINLISEASKNFLKYPTIVDMSHFNPQENCFYRKDSGYYGKSTKALNEFKLLIADIVSYAKQNAGKTILVETYLNRGFNLEHNVDSIDNQKIKLEFIVDEIKKYPGVYLSLVGHSQGGLVNLETAIERNFKINQLVSISTPYSPVYLGKKLIFLDFFFKIGGQSAYDMFVEKEYVSYYKSCVEQLCSKDYYDTLKNKWNNLSLRPKLTVITGTAGHLYNYSPGISTPLVYNPDTITKESFDGLVRFYEQANIEHADFIHLTDKNLSCYSEQKYAQLRCYYQNGFILTCKKKCSLSSVSVGSTIIDALFDVIDQVLKGTNINELAELKVVQAIHAGLKRNKDALPSGYDEYYNIYANDYNHNYIRYNKETIAYLLALLN